MKRPSKIIILCILLFLLLISGFMLYRYYSNVKLGEELREEIDEWLGTLPDVPYAQNGALVVLEGLNLLEEAPERLLREDNPIENESDSIAVQEYLKENKEALRLIRQGLAFNKWAYTTDYEKGIDATLPNTISFKNGGHALILKGDLEKLKGNGRDALDNYLEAIRFANTLSNERILLSRMIQIGICRKALSRVIQLAGDSLLSEDDLSHAIRKLIELHGKQGSAGIAFEWEYYYVMMYMSDYLTGRIKTEGAQDAASSYASSRMLYNFRVDMDIFKRWFEIYSTVNPAEYYKLPPELKDTQALHAKIGVPEPGSWYGVYAQFVPDLSGSVQGLAENEAVFRGTIAMMAIRLYRKRNGSLPGNLDQIDDSVPDELMIDPFSGKMMVYRVEGEDFHLYSIGSPDVMRKYMRILGDSEREIELREKQEIIFHVPQNADGKIREEDK